MNISDEEKKMLLDLYLALYPTKYPRVWPCDCPPALMDEKGNAVPLFSCPYCRFTRFVDGMMDKFPELLRAPLPAAEDAAPLVTFQAGEVVYGDNLETPQLDENGDLYY